MLGTEPATLKCHVIVCEINTKYLFPQESLSLGYGMIVSPGPRMSDLEILNLCKEGQ